MGIEWDNQHYDMAIELRIRIIELNWAMEFLHRHVELRDGNCCIAQGFVRSLLTRSQVGYIPRYDEEYFFVYLFEFKSHYLFGVSTILLVV